ncbi:tryptophan synthase subunit alpha [Hymenobacter properus]|uniref:Tryptophan synthase alpha chain n=1 Tax=Hymenobacter properus TaxID=2791026 RepID=A0A931BDR8_9BACT|nr:tryptophan synthase subunit alpha [Hymenobacter properus]MBF9140432.1 tryptophan synthase subunit alpha [Hymenobacter properus]MBR7719239.1 tryptophan synthase subunit alpha [Microvirga sp. SRT04]
MNRIAQAFASKQNLLNTYFTAGYPSLHDTIPLAKALVEAGADILEIGMPFSDPLADGPVIQGSSTVALANGMNLPVLFEQLKELRTAVPTTPVLLMGYLNPVMQFGIENFLKRAAEVGVDGLILPDLPLDEYEEQYHALFQQYGLKAVFLITPQTSEERIRRLDALSDAFLYLVSGPGTTGGTTLPDAEAQQQYFERIAGMNLKNPRLIGFGIADKAGFDRACQYANGAIIGSALIRALDGADDAPAAAARFVRGIRQA